MLSDIISNAPTYKLINVSIGIAVLTCTLVALIISYFIRRRDALISSSAHLPPLPCSDVTPGLSASLFPQRFDYLLTGFFLLGFFTLNIDLSPTIQEATTSDHAETSLLSGMINTLFLAIIYVPFAVRWLCLPSANRNRLSWKTVLLWIGATYLYVFCFSSVFELSGLMSWLKEITQTPTYQEVVEQLSRGSLQTQLLLAVSAIIIAPIGEELLFRGFLYPSLKPFLGKGGAIALSATLFGVFHMSLLQTPILIVFGVILALAYERARSLWLPILLHAIFNTVSILTITVLLPYFGKDL